MPPKVCTQILGGGRCYILFEKKIVGLSTWSGVYFWYNVALFPCSGILWRFIYVLMSLILFFWQSHAGKVVERHWYEKNKHIFPASRWEVCIYLCGCVYVRIYVCVWIPSCLTSQAWYSWMMLVILRKYRFPWHMHFENFEYSYICVLCVCVWTTRCLTSQAW